MQRIFAGVAILLTVAAATPPAEEPQKLGLTEKALGRLAQVEVALTGPREKLVGLTAAQFDVTIDGKDVVPVAIDPMCPGAPAGAQAHGLPGESAGEAAPPPTSYLFYFDQRNLTMGGRLNSLEQADGLIRSLIRDGRRGAIVSSGNRIDTLVDFTDRPELLLAALPRLRADTSQWDDYATLEPKREAEIGVLVRQRQPESACALARTYQREEIARSRQALELFYAVLGRFSRIDEPKIAVYFGDILRDQPGRHYLAPLGSRCESSGGDSMLSFQKIHEGAAAYGVKLYAVEAEGIMEAYTPGSSRDYAMRDGQGGLKALTLDTGGDAFLGGASVANMVRRIEADAACVYLLSFDPKPFPEDRPLALDVVIRVPGVRARAWTHLVIQSESARRSSMLLAAFLATGSGGDTSPIHGGVVPLDVKNGALRLLVQTSLPATTDAQRAVWDLGMSIISGAIVTREASGRVTVEHPGVAIALESDMEVESGDYEIAAAAVEDLSGRIAAGRIKGTWAGKVGASGIVGVAVLQHTTGAFLRDGKLRDNGSLVIADDQAVRADLPTAFVTLICRTARKQQTARVHSELKGDATITFPPTELALKDAACAQIRDVVPAGSLHAGPFTYTVRVDGAEAAASRNVVVAAAAPAGTSPP